MQCLKFSKCWKFPSTDKGNSCNAMFVRLSIKFRRNIGYVNDVAQIFCSDRFEFCLMICSRVDEEVEIHTTVIPSDANCLTTSNHIPLFAPITTANLKNIHRNYKFRNKHQTKHKSEKLLWNYGPITTANLKNTWKIRIVTMSHCYLHIIHLNVIFLTLEGIIS